MVTPLSICRVSATPAFSIIAQRGYIQFALSAAHL
jgi:hypothetical protein